MKTILAFLAVFMLVPVSLSSQQAITTATLKMLHKNDRGKLLLLDNFDSLTLSNIDAEEVITTTKLNKALEDERNKNKALEQKVKELETKLNQLEANRDKTESSLSKLQTDFSRMQSQFSSLERQVDQIERKIK